MNIKLLGCLNSSKALQEGCNSLQTTKLRQQTGQRLCKVRMHQKLRKIADFVYGWSLIEIVPVLVNMSLQNASFQAFFFDLENF